MSVLPTNTLLGKLEIIEIYEHYDQPLLFACRNASDNLYLVVLEDEEDEFENWLYASMSPARFAQVRSGGIDLYNAFKNAEDGFVFLVKLYRDRQIPSVITKVPTDQLQDEQLPESGEALNLETATLEKKEISVQRRAAQLYREYVEMALEFPGQRRTEAPISVLSDIIETPAAMCNHPLALRRSRRQSMSNSSTVRKSYKYRLYRCDKKDRRLRHKLFVASTIWNHFMRTMRRASAGTRRWACASYRSRVKWT